MDLGVGGDPHPGLNGGRSRRDLKGCEWWGNLKLGGQGGSTTTCQPQFRWRNPQPTPIHHILFPFRFLSLIYNLHLNQFQTF